MDSVQTSPKRRKKDKKPLYILIVTLVFFIFFIYLITRPSIQSKAIDEIQICNNLIEVKQTYEKYKFELIETDENDQKIVSLEFQDAIRKRLASFNLSDSDINDCISWLPPAPTSLNLIIVPDLSRRILDSSNNPNQIENDIIVLKSIWKSFVESSKLKQGTKDRLIIDVTDIDQANGQFGDVANKLQFDLSNHKGKSNRLFFTPEKDTQFESGIRKMYELAILNPIGADYRFYFQRYLKNLIKKPTLFDNYINKVVIITDGYLEPEHKPADTKIYGYEKILHQAVSNGNILDVINSNALNILRVDIDLTNTKLLVCEVTERRFIQFTKIVSTGRNFDFEILNTYWEDWFKRMGAKKENITFLQRELATDITTKKVAEFIAK